MKKVKLTTATLAILAGVAFAAPATVNAEGEIVAAGEELVTVDSGVKSATEGSVDAKDTTVQPAAAQGLSGAQAPTEGTTTTPKEATPAPYNAADDAAKTATVKRLADKLYNAGQITVEERGNFVARAGSSSAELTKVLAELEVLNEKLETINSLTALKEDAVNKLMDVSEKLGAERDALIAKVRAFKSASEINGHLAAAKKITDFWDVRNNAYLELDAIKTKLGMSDAAYTALKTQIDGATSEDMINIILQEARKGVAAKDAKAKLDQYVTSLGGQMTISLAEYNWAKSLVAATTTMPTIKAAEAQIADLLKVISIRADKIAILEGYVADELLTEARKNDFVTEIKEAKSMDRINELMNQAFEEFNVPKAKEHAKKIIESFKGKNGLTDARINDFIGTIDFSSTNTTEKVNELLKAATVEHELAVFKYDATAKLVSLNEKDGLINSTERGQYYTKLMAATKIEDAQKLMDELAKVTDFRAAKNKASDDLYKAVYDGKLSLSDYYYFVGLLNDVETVEEAQNIVTTAVKFGEAKRAALKELEGLEDKMSAVAYKEFKEQLETDAKTIEDIEGTMKQARLAAGVTETTDWTEIKPGTKPTEDST
ncbi:hypothetical protein, partial [Vagococcus sp.]|uniref:hypothetical protein n=1 Tax=Vagococcus sp. TaxID=1933889 RepID=UPI003F9BFC4A